MKLTEQDALNIYQIIEWVVAHIEAPWIGNMRNVLDDYSRMFLEEATRIHNEEVKKQ